MELEQYEIDAPLSSLKLRIFAAASAACPIPTLAIREFAGWARFATGTFDQACIHITMNAGSLSLVETMADESRSAIERTLASEVLEVEKYPEIVFCSSRVSFSRAGDGQYWINLVGELSLHGVSGTQPVAAQVALTGDTLRVHGEFTFLQAPYNIRGGFVPGGSLKLRDEVKCFFDILAHRQADSVNVGRCAMGAEG